MAKPAQCLLKASMSSLNKVMKGEKLETLLSVRHKTKTLCTNCSLQQHSSHAVVHACATDHPQITHTA
jgi:hypothetical protein